MANILYLVHRLPYPPNKGDKVRSYHLLKHLQKNHRVFLGTFIDDAEDDVHLPALKAMCPDVYVGRISPPVAKIKSLLKLVTGEALTLGYYQHAGLLRWVARIEQTIALDATVVFSSAMALFAPKHLPMLVDFVDVDSAKWAQYANNRTWPMSWLYRREAQRLLTFERRVAASSCKSFFVTANEVKLFERLAPECAQRVEALQNGVDATYFQPDSGHSNPFATDEVSIVFTGAMDYWPNIDAVAWFVADVMPKLLVVRPQIRFYIVGRNPSGVVRALSGDHVVVTGTVNDVRPYLQHAAAVVAPLRVARGIQNKILEAMAMGQAVVTVPDCADAIGADEEHGLFRAADAEAFVSVVERFLCQTDSVKRLGLAARHWVITQFSWDAHLSGLDMYLNRALAKGDSA